MELDELKDTWLSLDERLRKQEILKESILKEMIHSKADKSLSRLINTEIVGIIILLLVMPAIVYAIDFHPHLPGYTVFMWAMIPICVIGLLWQILKVYKLTRINLTESLSNNIRYTNTYNIWIKREKMVMVVIIPLVGLCVAYLYAQLNVNTTLWAFLTCTFIALCIFTYWSYKKLYNKNIASIMKSLDELKELEEE
jgi:Na+/melibiose symporter-like transporter